MKWPFALLALAAGALFASLCSFLVGSLTLGLLLIASRQTQPWRSH